MRWFAVAVVACACAYACSFRANNSNGKQDGKLDSIVLNEAGACQTVSAGCSGDMLITCTSVGATPSTATCAWGCSDLPSPHCGKLQPTGNGVVPTDLDPDSTLADITLGGTIDGSSGAITGTFTRGSGSGVIAGVDYQVRNGIAIFRFNSVHVTGKLALVGGNPIALVANGPITIDALIDAQGGCSGGTAVAGGSVGGNSQTTAVGSGGGSGGSGTGNMASGGGGGGNGSAGGGGGSGNGGHNRTSGGAAFDSLMPLGGGGGGGGGGGNSGHGGGGGGALQLASNATVTINPTGAINAGGCGGKVGGDGAAGGGAGGTLLFEGVVVHVTSGGQLAVNGGGGGGGDSNGKAGSNAQLGTNRAAGGTPDNMGGLGGRGGASGFLIGEAGSDAPNGGGGGGGVGRIRFETRAGSATIDLGAVLSPSLAETGTTTTQTPALVK